ncbi:MAG: hypothetical protein IKF78_06855 [Atopobiaceae bacterium]|nr:hypothetical protein [Atopobiaceae bacterium]
MTIQDTWSRLPIRSLARNALLLVCGVLVGTLLLICSYALPTGPMREHILFEVDDICSSKEALPGRANAGNDATDMQMLAIAASELPEGKGLIENVMMAPYLVPASPDVRMTQEAILRATVDPEAEGRFEIYPRYWHGYLALLKPQLLVMDYYSILMLNGMALLCLFTAFVVLLFRHDLGRFAPAFVLAFLLGSPVTVSLNMQYYSCAYITLLALIAMLVLYKRLESMDKGLFGSMFLLIGMVTNYVDFLTYPIMTLGMPLALLAVMQRGTNRSFGSYVANALWWLVGYGGMWAAKWGLSALVLGPQTLQEVVNQLIVRSSSQAATGIGDIKAERVGSLSYYDALYGCWVRIIGAATLRVLIGSFALANVVYVVWAYKGGRMNKVPVGSVLALVFAALLPFFWVFVLKNHTYMHSYFVYRIFLVTIAALGCIPPLLVKDKSIAVRAPAPVPQVTTHEVSERSERGAARDQAQAQAWSRE